MFPKFPPKSSKLPTMATVEAPKFSFIRTFFVITNIIAGFAAAAALLISDAVRKEIHHLVPVVSGDFENFLHFFMIFAFLSTFLHIFGCYCVDVGERKPLLIFLVMSSLSFVILLTWLAYYLQFVETFVTNSVQGWKNVGGDDQRLMKMMISCHSDDCDGKLEAKIHSLMMEIVKTAGVMLSLTLICKFVGSAYICKLERDSKKSETEEFNETQLMIHYNNNQLNIV